MAETIKPQGKIFYTADLHLGHENIIKLCRRPFSSIEEMDEYIIRNWNAVVSEQDTVIILGDFCYKSQNPSRYLKQLNGKKYLIIGNHDTTLLKDKNNQRFFEGIYDIANVVDNGTWVFCCHYPLVEWPGYFRNALHFYGHIHNNSINLANKVMKNIPHAYNVGMDLHNFTPKTLEEIINKETK